MRACFINIHRYIYNIQNSGDDDGSKTLWQIERNQIGKRHRHEFPAHNCGTFYATAIHRTFYPQDDQTICFGEQKKIVEYMHACVCVYIDVNVLYVYVWYTLCGALCTGNMLCALCKAPSDDCAFLLEFSRNSFLSNTLFTLAYFHNFFFIRFSLVCRWFLVDLVQLPWTSEWCWCICWSIDSHIKSLQCSHMSHQFNRLLISSTFGIGLAKFMHDFKCMLFYWMKKYCVGCVDCSYRKINCHYCIESLLFIRWFLPKPHSIIKRLSIDSLNEWESELT